MTGQILAVNTGMLTLAKALGFVIEDTSGDISTKNVTLVLA